MRAVRAVAIVNGNRVRGRQRAKLAALGARFTASLAEARDAVREEVKRGRDLVIFGGGDGTVVMGLTLLAEACRGSGKPEPAVGVLRLGSGNAIAAVVGAGDPVADLARLLRGDARTRSVAMLDVMGVRAPFVGVGIDAQLLEDHAGSRLPGALGYALSVATRSLPRFALGDRPRATVTNLGAPAREMGRTGPTGVVFAANETLWTGDCTLVAGATIPSFGFGLKMFAFASRTPDRFQLRCGDAGLFEILRNAPAAFRGDYFSDRVRDFLCDRIRIDLDREAQVEAGGELLGKHARIEVRMTTPVSFAVLK